MPRGRPARQEPPFSGPMAEWAPYPRPDRAEIAARVHAELADAQPDRLMPDDAFMPGGWDFLGRRELAELRGELDGSAPADVPAATAPPPRRDAGHAATW
jgi:hypothetical protein